MFLLTEENFEEPSAIAKKSFLQQTTTLLSTLKLSVAKNKKYYEPNYLQIKPQHNSSIHAIELSV